MMEMTYFEKQERKEWEKRIRREERESRPFRTYPVEYDSPSKYTYMKQYTTFIDAVCPVRDPYQNRMEEMELINSVMRSGSIGGIRIG